MNIQLTPELEQFIRECVASGAASSPSEVVQEALRLLRDEAVRLEELKREVAIGVEQAKRGECVSSKEVFENMRQIIRSKQVSASTPK